MVVSKPQCPVMVLKLHVAPNSVCYGTISKTLPTAWLCCVLGVFRKLMLRNGCLVSLLLLRCLASMPKVMTGIWLKSEAKRLVKNVPSNCGLVLCVACSTPLFVIWGLVAGQYLVACDLGRWPCSSRCCQRFFLVQSRLGLETSEAL